MDAFSVGLWFFSIGPFLPCLALISTGLTVLLLQIIAALAHEYV